MGKITEVRHTINGRETDALGIGITPPAVFCLDENLSGTLAFFADFRHKRLQNHNLPRPNSRKTWIGLYADIAAIQTITPAAALILAAEFDRAHRSNRLGRRGIVNARNWDPSVTRVLTDLGFLEHLNTVLPEHQEIGSTDTPQRHTLRMLSGNLNEPEKAEELKQGLAKLMDELSVDHSDQKIQQVIYNGLIEAMDNCVAHAYPEDHLFPFPVERQRWWMSGFADSKCRELEVIFFDQGATIPARLPHSNKREIITDWLKSFKHLGFNDASDALRIQAAMQQDKSSLKDQGELCSKVGDGLIKRLLEVGAIRL